MECPKCQHGSELYHVSKWESEDTGGGCVVDLLTLDDGSVIVVSGEEVALYPSRKAWDNSYDNPEAVASFPRVHNLK